jgi:hypothetical protein
MAKLEDLKQNMTIRGVLPDSLVTVVNVDRVGDFAITITYRDAGAISGAKCCIATGSDARDTGRRRSLGYDGMDTSPSCERGYRIKLAYLFDPYWQFTLHGEPLPHQITAVYGEMIPRT